MKINIIVKTRAKVPEVVKIDGSNYRVSVKEIAKDGQANKAIIKILAHYFDCSQRAVQIVRGLRSKHKLVNIDD